MLASILEWPGLFFRETFEVKRSIFDDFLRPNEDFDSTSEEIHDEIARVLGSACNPFANISGHIPNRVTRIARDVSNAVLEIRKPLPDPQLYRSMSKLNGNQIPTNHIKPITNN